MQRVAIKVSIVSAIIDNAMRAPSDDAMRLFLASYRFGGQIDQLVALAGAGMRTAVVSNALDAIPDAHREVYRRTVFDVTAVLRDAGLESFDLDLRPFFGRPEALAAELRTTGLVFATGGNSFLLRRAMRRSGLDDLLKRRTSNDTIAYGGWSAGACVAGASLQGIDLMDDPFELAAGYDREPVYDGLGLVDRVILPHFRSEHPEAAAAAAAAEHLSALGVDHLTLGDAEVLVVHETGAVVRRRELG